MKIFITKKYFIGEVKHREWGLNGFSKGYVKLWVGIYEMLNFALEVIVFTFALVLFKKIVYICRIINLKIKKNGSN